MYRFRLLTLVFFALALVVVALVPGPIAEAKGPPGQIKISGLGLRGEVTVTSANRLRHLGIAELEDYSIGVIDTPVVAGSGFHIRRGYLDEKGDFVAFDELVYYPDPAGGTGYLMMADMQYENILNGKAVRPGDWFQAIPQAEADLLTMLIMYGAQIVRVTAETDTLPEKCLVADVAYLAVGFADAVSLADLAQLEDYLSAGFERLQVENEPAITNADDALARLLTVRRSGEQWYVTEVRVDTSLVEHRVNLEFSFMRGPIGTRIINDKVNAKEMLSTGRATFACNTQTLISWEVGVTKHAETDADFAPVLCPAPPSSDYHYPVLACAAGHDVAELQ